MPGPGFLEWAIQRINRALVQALRKIAPPNGHRRKDECLSRTCLSLVSDLTCTSEVSAILIWPTIRWDDQVVARRAIYFFGSTAEPEQHVTHSFSCDNNYYTVTSLSVGLNIAWNSSNKINTGSCYPLQTLWINYKSTHAMASASCFVSRNIALATIRCH